MMELNKSYLNFHLDNQIILITGATGYLGEAISLGVAQMGGIALICGRTQSKLNKLAQKIQLQGGKVHIECCDISKIDVCKSMMQRIKKQFARLDGIVNCAYSGRTGTIESAEESDFEMAQKISVNAPFFLVQEGLDMLKKTAKNKLGGASIVNISSMYGQVSPDPSIYGSSGKNNPPFYGAAKAAMIQMTRYLACHLGEHNIRVNSLCPGPFPPDSIKQTNPSFHERLCTKNPMGRIGIASELVGPVIFLLSAASSYVNGANLAVDGGWTSW